MKTKTPLLIAAVLLALPLLYVVSYLVLVTPPGPTTAKSSLARLFGPPPSYRIEGKWPGKVFWPIERLDRKLRPKAWPTIVNRSEQIERDLGFDQ